jgi:non-heme chloroperoxidase
MRRSRALAIGTAIALGVFLATAPLWASAMRLGAPPLPPAGRMVTITGGTRINVFDEGRGPAVVLVHGLPGSAHDWAPLPEMLVRAGFRVIRYDRVGYGRSDRRTNDGRYGLDMNAEDLHGLVTALALESPLLAGWSYGGGVVLRAAADHARNVGGVLLLGSLGPATRMVAPPAFIEPVQRWGIASALPVRVGLAVMGARFFGGPPPAGWSDHALSVVSAPGVLHTWMSEARSTDVGALRLDRVTAPVRLLHGSEDRVSPLSVAVDLERRLPRSRLTIVAGGSHMLPNTHAALVVEAVHELRLAGD